MLRIELTQDINAAPSNETILGTLGDDRIRCKRGNDLAQASDGNDTIFGGKGNDNLRGQKDYDRIRGGEGNDTVDGGVGADILIGGTGSDLIAFEIDSRCDRAVFRRIEESQVGSQHDKVQSFHTNEDRIDLRKIDADTSTMADDAFHWIRAANFSEQAGELRYADHLLQGDVDGDGSADFEILILGGADEPVASDILL